MLNKEEQYPQEMPMVVPYSQEEIPEPQTPIEVIEGALDILKRDDEGGREADTTKPTIH